MPSTPDAALLFVAFVQCGIQEPRIHRCKTRVTGVVYILE